MASASFSGLSPRHRGGTQPTRLGPMLGALLICLLAVRAPADSATRLDDFTDLSGWTATASEGASIHIDRDAGRTGGAMRLSYDLGAGGFVMVRKAFDLTLPANYAFTFDVRGVAADNHFEFKLVDHSGGNVWWYKQRHFEFPADWRTIVVKQRRLQFAWGPVGGGSPRQITHVEFAVAAAAGGRGTLWLSDFRLEPRAAVALGDGPPAISASSASAAHDPERALDDDPTTAWKSLPTAAPQCWRLTPPAK